MQSHRSQYEAFLGQMELATSMAVESETKSESPKVWVLAQRWSLRFEEDTDPGHVLLLNCTLSLVLRSFGCCTVLVDRATSSMCTFS